MVSPAAAGQPVVAENLSAFARRGPWTETRAIELLPRLNERKKNLPLPDEPLEDLAPIIVEELRRAICRVAREEGLSAIVVEQQPQMVLGVTDQTIMLDGGPLAYRANSVDLLNDPAPLEACLGVAANH